MRSDKTMKLIITFILVFYTIIQVFYFAQIDIIPTGVLTINTLVNILVFVLEASVLVGLSILITYILPIVCVVRISFVFTELKEVDFPRVPNRGFLKNKLVFTNTNIIQKLQVIRC